MDKLKLALKILGLIFLIMSISLTGYYYVYLWFIVSKNIENKTIVPNIEEEVILNEVEELYSIDTLLHNDTQFNKTLKFLLSEKRQGTMSINIWIQDEKILNELFNHDFFDRKKGETYINVLINYGWTINDFYINWKINWRIIKIIWKYDNAYIYINDFVWNGFFSMINDDRLNFYLDDLNWYITYDTFKDIKIDFIPLDIIDKNIWASKVDLITSILWWIEKIFTCNNNECYLSINKNTILKINLIVDNSKELTPTQKTLIKDLSGKLFSHLNGTNINLWNDKFDFWIKSSALPIALDVDYDLWQKVDVSFNYKQYTYKYLDDVVNDFNKNNAFFVSIMHWNNDIVDSLLQ